MLKITVYSTETCPHCINLKRWLDDQSIKYDSYNVDENPIAASNLARLSDAGIVPFSTIELANGQIEKIIGFDKERFKKLLDK